MMNLCCPRQYATRNKLNLTTYSRLLVLLVLAFLFWVIQQLFTALPENKRPDGYESKVKFVVDTPGCTIPDLDPFDVSLKDIVFPGDPLICSAKPSLTYLDKGALRINKTALEKYYDDDIDRCQYENIIRPLKARSDNVFKYDHAVDFTEDVEDVDIEFIRVACFGKKGRLLYANFHAATPLKDPVEKRCERNFQKFKQMASTDEIFDFIILGVDSVSRLNFIRQMPKTRKFLTEKVNAVELKGYNKVADNTFVNLSPMFAGKFVEELMLGDINKEVAFDNYSFIWKDAAAMGYRTLFAEDAPNIAIFNYEKEGFHEAPTDYYLRPFSLAVENHGSVWNSNHNCIGPKPETEVVLDYVHDFSESFRKKPKFAFSFITRLTHDGINKAGAADELYYRFFERMYTRGHLRNSVVLFYSDHGMRFGDIRETYIGQLEERLPFLLLALPDQFTYKYPQYLKSLRKNANRLTNPFDIYTTLKSLLVFEDSIPANNLADRGMNLLVNVPEARTCQDASIDSHWCTCHKQEQIDPKSDIIQLAGSVAVDYINKLLYGHGIMCSTLVLDKVSEARVIIPNTKMANKQISIHDMFSNSNDRMSPITEYVITFRTNPGGGMFEANVRKSTVDKTLDVVGEISRINAYGDQSVCIRYHQHKKFCYCS